MGPDLNASPKCKHEVPVYRFPITKKPTANKLLIIIKPNQVISYALIMIPTPHNLAQI